MRLLLLILVVEDVDVPVGTVVAHRIGAQLVDLGDLVRRELDLVKVARNARRRDRLGDDRVRLLGSDLRPGEDDLRAVDGFAETLRCILGNRLDLRRVYQQRLADRIVAKGRVGRDVDVLLGAVVDQLGLKQKRVALDLVGGRDDAGGLDDALKLRGWSALGGGAKVWIERTASILKLDTPT